MAVPVSEFDPGHMHLAALMFRQGVTRMEITIEEIDTMLAYTKANGLQLVVMTNEDGAVIQFLPEGALDGLEAGGIPEGTLVN